MSSKRIRATLLVVLGFVLGFALAIAIPAQAHCGRYTPWGHCWGHVKTLQSKVATLEFEVDTLQSQLSQVSSLSSRISALEAKTSKLSTLNGSYTGTISGTQVTGTIGASQVDTPLLCIGNPAYWQSFGDGLTC